MATKRLSKRRRVLALGFGTVLALLFAEAAFWVFDLGPQALITKRWLLNEDQPGVLYHCYPSNPHLEFRSVPDTDQGRWRLESALLEPEPIDLSRLEETPYCVEYRESSQGLRDREYSLRPDPGIVRILGIGDSFAVGEGVPIELSLFRHLAQALGSGVEVLNGAQPGVNTRQELGVLQRLARHFSCRRALVVFVPNDVELTPELARSQDYINDLINIRAEKLDAFESKAWYVGHSRLLHRVGSILAMRRIAQETVRWYEKSYDPSCNGRNLDKLERHFRRMSSNPNLKTLLILYPLLEGFRGTYPLAGVHRRIAEIADRAGLPVFDLAPAFAGTNPEDLWVHPIDHHPNGRAHAIAAEAIARWLREEQSWVLE